MTCGVRSVDHGGREPRAGVDWAYLRDPNRLLGGSGQPPDQILPQSAITCPVQELWRRPVRRAIGRERGGTSAPVRPGREQRIVADGKQNFGFGFGNHAVVAQEERPGPFTPSRTGCVGNFTSGATPSGTSSRSSWIEHVTGSASVTAVLW